MKGTLPSRAGEGEPPRDVRLSVIRLFRKRNAIPYEGDFFFSPCLFNRSGATVGD